MGSKIDQGVIQGKRVTEALSDGQIQLRVAVEQAAIPVADGDRCGGIPPADGSDSSPLARPAGLPAGLGQPYLNAL